MAQCTASRLACGPARCAKITLLRRNNTSARSRLTVTRAERLSHGLLVERPGTHSSPPAHGRFLLPEQAAADDAAVAGQAQTSATANMCFGSLSAFLATVTVSATSPDWYLDAGCFALVYATLWWTISRAKLWQPSQRTLVLATLLPVMHMLGATGMYHWELGNLSWDVLVHLTNGFMGTLMFHSLLTSSPDQPSAGTASAGAGAATCGSTGSPGTASPGSKGTSSSCGAQRGTSAVATEAGTNASPQWSGKEVQDQAPGASSRPVWLRLVAVAALLLVGTSLIEVVEWAGGVALDRPGEGMFFRGAGDFCTAAQPCSEGTDSAKDMVDNIAGMMLALVSIATGHTSSAPTTVQQGQTQRRL